MKTLCTAMLVIASCFLTSLTSCTEDSLLHESNVTADSEKISFRSDPHINRYYYDNGDTNGTLGVDYGCKPPAISCFDDVVVTGQKLNVVNSIFNNIGSWTTSQLQDYVDDHSADVSDIIGADETSGIISGSYTLVTKGNSLQATRFLITKSGLSIVSVTPIDN